MARWLETKTVIEKFMLTSKGWSDGYKVFNRLFGKPLGWLILFQDGKNRIIRLDQKGHCSFYASSQKNQSGCELFLLKYFEQLKDRDDPTQEIPNHYKCAYGREGIVFRLQYLNQLKGYLVLCAVSKSRREVEPYIPTFEQLIKTHVELAYKNFELQNFYETVHPRALALSTMHSVHRVISSSLRLDELLPKIGRLCAQVLKAQGCSIYLIDEDKKHIVPKFTLMNGKSIDKKMRLKLGRGIEGHVADTAEFYYTKRCISVPFIEEDVIGAISLRDKVDRESFTKTDLEILKTLSEQAVVAIKNAKLFEETEHLTLSSIQAINELLELSYAGTNSLLPLFGELVFELGRECRMSGIELTNLQRATLLIDAGYLGTPESILTKKSKLTKSEFEAIKKHPHIGASVLKKVGSLKLVIPIILHHHERFDGKGYPHGLKGEEIPIGARIVSVVDAFIAMVSERPYRSRKALREALHEIRVNAGTQFDPAVVEPFLRLFERPDVIKKIEKICDQHPVEMMSE